MAAPPTSSPRETAWVVALGVAGFFLLQGVHARASQMLTTVLPDQSLLLGPLLYLCVLPLGGLLLFRHLLPRLFLKDTDAWAGAAAHPSTGENRPAWLRLLGAGASGLGLAALSFALWWVGRAEASLSVPADSTPGPGLSPWHMAVAILVTPVLEEWFYRRELQGFLGRGHRLLAVVLQAALFALVHPMPVAPMLFLVGLVCGVLYWRQGLSSAIVAHAVYNAALIGLHGGLTR